MPEALSHDIDAMMAELNAIKDPCSVANGTPMGLGEMGLIDTIDVDETGAVAVRLRLTSPFCHMIGFFKQEAGRRLMALPGVTSVALTADNGLDWTPERMNGPMQRQRQQRLAHMQALPA